MPVDLARLAKAIGAGSAECDAQGSFPDAAFAALKEADLLARPPVDADATPELLKLLAAIGRGDLSTGRLYEGHVNAVILTRQFAKGAALDRANRLLSSGAVFGVWNTDAPQDPLTIENGVLAGKKNFASGVERLSHAIVTTGSMAERMMWLVPVEDLPIDRSWWKPMGMRSSGSHVVDFTGLRVQVDWALGSPGDYTGYRPERSVLWRSRWAACTRFWMSRSTTFSARLDPKIASSNSGWRGWRPLLRPAICGSIA